MNSHCGICDVEKQCGYEYKPCDCCNYRKFKPKEQPEQTAQVIQFQNNDRQEQRKECGL